MTSVYAILVDADDPIHATEAAAKRYPGGQVVDVRETRFLPPSKVSISIGKYPTRTFIVRVER